MLKNSRFTAFIFSELLSKYQKGGGGKNPPSTQIRLKAVDTKLIALVILFSAH